MEDLYEELAPIEFSEAERRCAAVMCLVNNSGDITNREIQNATGITMKTIQRTAPGSGNRAGKSEIRKIPDIRRISGRYPEFSGYPADIRQIYGGFPADIRWISGGYPAGGFLIFRHSAPCHVSHRAMAWIEEHAYDCVTKDMWPPSSPDLNPMDYFVWGYLESRVNRRPHTTKASLIASIKEQFASMPSTLMKRACGRFRTRITAVIEAEGNYIERS